MTVTDEGVEPLPGQPPGRFRRTIDLYGERGFARIRAARVVVVGLGGVGSHAALALARSGVGSLLLCDFDRITASSLNRNPLAGPDDVGLDKTEVAARALRVSCPDTVVETRRDFIDRDQVAEVLGGAWLAAAPLEPDLDDLLLRRGRVRRRQPSAICLPGIFGYALATEALDRLARETADPGEG